MKKTVVFLLCVLLAISVACIPAAAADNTAQLANIYYKDARITAFIASDDAAEIVRSRVGFKYDGDLLDAWSDPKLVSESDATVSYLLLIDASDSMPYYANRVHKIAEGLTGCETQNYSVTVATVGASFRIVEEKITSAQRVVSAVDSIQYTDTVSEICDGVLDAIEYLKSQKERDADIQNIVLITDGDTYMTDTGRSPDAIKRIADTTEQIVKQSTEYTIHTVGLETWDPETLAAISVSQGIDVMATDSDSALRSGESIARFVDHLAKVDIPYNRTDYSARFDGEIIITPTNTLYTQTLSASGIRNFDVKDSIVIPHFDDEGNLITTDDKPQIATQPDEPAQPTDDIKTNPTEETADPADGEDRPATADEAGGGTILGLPMWAFIAIIGGAILLIALVILLIVKASRKKQPQAPAAPIGQPAPQKPMSCITIIPEVLYGTAHCADKELKLYDELIIGSAPDCDIVVEDSVAAPRNTRIFVENGTVFIEDMNDNSQTYVEGMKIFNKNRLRSGDEIMVGDTTLKLRF